MTTIFMTDTTKLSARVIELHRSPKFEDKIAAILMDRSMGAAGLTEHDAREKALHVMALMAMERR